MIWHIILIVMSQIKVNSQVNKLIIKYFHANYSAHISDWIEQWSIVQVLKYYPASGYHFPLIGIQDYTNSSTIKVYRV
jgi:hypothetical protein